MKPYFENGTVTLYCADCRDVLPTLPKASVHLIVTDPPYGVKWRSHFRNESFQAIIGDDSPVVALEGLRLAIAALAIHRHVYAFGRYDWSSLPIGSVAELIWDKNQHGMGNAASGWTPQHEYIQFGAYVPSVANREAGRGIGAARIRRGSVLRFPRPNGMAVQRHPTEKPVPLLRELIEMSSRIGETVLDPFAGVGSTLVAAQLEGRKAIGIEIEERYCAIAAERLAQAVMVFDDL